MNRTKLTQRFQNSPFTRWWWKYWIHNTNGEIIILPWYKSPKNYIKYNVKE